MALATAAFLLGRTNDVVQALQRAYQAKLDLGDVPGAVRVAYWLTVTLWGAGEVSPIFSGVVYCSSIGACQEISDFDRAGQWTHALTNWCDSQPGLVAFTGQCAVHRGQLMKLHGAFEDAVAELHHARPAAACGRPVQDGEMSPGSPAVVLGSETSSTGWHQGKSEPGRSELSLVRSRQARPAA